MEGLTLEEIVTKATGGIFNNAGQILNHNLYFEQLQAPSDDNRPIGNIAQAIEEQFGSVDAFKENPVDVLHKLFDRLINGQPRGFAFARIALNAIPTVRVVRNAAGGPVRLAPRRLAYSRQAKCREGVSGLIEVAAKDARQQLLGVFP